MTHHLPSPDCSETNTAQDLQAAMLRAEELSLQLAENIYDLGLPAFRHEVTINGTRFQLQLTRVDAK